MFPPASNVTWTRTRPAVLPLAPPPPRRIFRGPQLPRDLADPVSPEKANSATMNSCTPPGTGSRAGISVFGFARDLGGDSWRLGRGDERLRRPGGGSLPQIRDFGPVLRKVQLRERVQGGRSQ
jgi:hypothetical protein